MKQGVVCAGCFWKALHMLAGVPVRHQPVHALASGPGVAGPVVVLPVGQTLHVMLFTAEKLPLAHGVQAPTST